MMHDRQQCISSAKPRCGLGQSTKRQPIDRDSAALRDVEKGRLCRGARRITWQWKSIAQPNDIDLPAETTKLRDHASVIGIATGRGCEIARHGECQALYHRSALYQARAKCDSESVTRIALSSRPGRPSSPARAALAS